MKQNIKTYVDIEEIIINDNVGDQICYSVTFINQYDLVICGINFGRKENKIHIPFYFKSLDIAKDFSQFKPKCESFKFYNGEYSDRGVYYSTYKIYAKDKICYVKWEINSTIKNDGHNYIFSPIETPIVDTFVTNIKLKNWWCTHGIGSIYFINENQKLSNTIDAINFKNKKWHFELVENNEK